VTRRRPTDANAPTFDAADEGKLVRLLRTLARQAAREALRALRDSNAPGGSQHGPPIQQDASAEGTISHASNGSNEHFFSVAQVADRLGLSEKSVRRKIAKGELHARQMGRLLRIGERSLAAYIAGTSLKKGGDR
jgi:excisionase family DNA binding protein